MKTVYTVEQKANIIRLIRSGTRKVDISRSYKIPISTISVWLRNEKRFLLLAKSAAQRHASSLKTKRARISLGRKNGASSSSGDATTESAKSKNESEVSEYDNSSCSEPSTPTKQSSDPSTRGAIVCTKTMKLNTMKGSKSRLRIHTDTEKSSTFVKSAPETPKKRKYHNQYTKRAEAKTNLAYKQPSHSQTKLAQRSKLSKASSLSIKRSKSVVSKAKSVSNSTAAVKTREQTVPESESNGSTAPRKRIIRSGDPILRLRIPRKLCKMLPSVQKFNSREIKQFTKNKPEVKAESLEKQLDEKRSLAELNLGVRKRRGERQRYQLIQIGEQKYKGMIWDVGVSTMGDLVISHMDGAELLDNHLESSTKLENIYLGGGICFLSDQRIVVLCRCFDRVNIYTPTGSLISSFAVGRSPQNVAAMPNDNLVITDISDKCLNVYDLNGEKLKTIPPIGDGYEIAWPLYIANIPGTYEVIVSDCDKQRLFKFNCESGAYSGEFKAKTYMGDQVLRPHGLATSSDGDIMVVDTAVDSVEVFHSQDDGYLQTLLQTDDVSTGMRLKAVSVSSSGHLAVGCMSGLVRLYKTSMVNASVPLDCLKVKIQADLSPVASPVKDEHTRSTRARSIKRRSSDLDPCTTATEVKRVCSRTPDDDTCNNDVIIVPDMLKNVSSAARSSAKIMAEVTAKFSNNNSVKPLTSPSAPTNENNKIDDSVVKVIENVSPTIPVQDGCVIHIEDSSSPPTRAADTEAIDVAEKLDAVKKNLSTTMKLPVIDEKDVLPQLKDKCNTPLPSTSSRSEPACDLSRLHGPQHMSCESRKETEGGMCSSVYTSDDFRHATTGTSAVVNSKTDAHTPQHNSHSLLEDRENAECDSASDSDCIVLD